MRVKKMLFAVTLVSCAAFAASQPVSCLQDDHCFAGKYCETSVYQCQDCLICHDLKREPPPSPRECIKSVRECGPSLIDPGGGSVVSSLPPAAPPTPPAPSAGAGAGDSSSTAMWIAAGVVIALFLTMVAAIFIRYMLKNSDIFKFKFDTNISASLPPVQYAAPTAPESPPPYSPPRADPAPTFTAGKDADTSSRPLIEGYQPPLASYESRDDRQNVSVFSAPAYVRLYNGPTSLEAHNDVNENYAPFVQDEDTTPSSWVPTADFSDVNSNPAVIATHATEELPESPASAGDISTALAIARNTDLIHHDHHMTEPTATYWTQSVSSSEAASSGDGAYAHNNAQGGAGAGEGVGGGGGGGGAAAHQAGGAGAGAGGAAGKYNVMNVNQVINIFKPQLSKRPNTGIH